MATEHTAVCLAKSTPIPNKILANEHFIEYEVWLGLGAADRHPTTLLLFVFFLRHICAPKRTAIAVFHFVYFPVHLRSRGMALKSSQNLSLWRHAHKRICFAHATRLVSIHFVKCIVSAFNMIQPLRSNNSNNESAISRLKTTHSSMFFERANIVDNERIETLSPSSCLWSICCVCFA